MVFKAMEPLQPPPDNRQDLIDRLEVLQPDPLATIATLKDGLQVNDLEDQLGHTQELPPHSADVLSEGAFKMIEALRKLVILFSRHGILGPQQQGLWLTEQNQELWVGDEMK